ncbi:LysM domain-containing protein [Massilia sp. METH4]|uniref:LysM peptidoglycan-binding domain-containing protein n=1 Tax=Massilia sp. METH4 TaxID=3123041 RepID=UPI0030CAAAC7
MATPKGSFEMWKDGLIKGVGQAKWHTYDCEIKTSISEFDRHLAGSPGYVIVDWRLVKAMLWVETGAGHIQWRVKPMQIGVLGDPGLDALLGGKEGGDIIMPPSLKATLDHNAARTIPSYNIRAGIAYLLMRMAKFEFRSVVSDDPKIYEAPVNRGDSMARIAKVCGTTTDILRQLNPKATILRPGQVLLYRKGAVQRVIVGWLPFAIEDVAKLYNGGGDVRYAEKLSFALKLVKYGSEATCA